MKYLIHLRDDEGMPTEDIVENHVFLTAGACGPCRFGTYVTEYRKALRDSGFDGFRVLLFQQQGGLKQATGEASGLEMNAEFFMARRSRRSMAGDVLNARRLPHPPLRGRAGRDRRGARGVQGDHLRRASSNRDSVLDGAAAMPARG